MKFLYFINLFPIFTMATCRIYSIEQPDGSYSFNLNSDATGTPAESVIDLLSKSASYNIDNNETGPQPSQKPQQGRQEFDDNYYSVEQKDLLSPHLEILQLIETFIKFKGELASRFQALISDNWDMIRSIYMTAVSKIGTLHNFTLIGIHILRKVLSLAVTLMSSWRITLPSVDFDLNVGNQGHSSGFSSMFSVNKNGNLYRKK